eukprot:9472190-Pyramimonas_sp.AAC.1
MPAILATSGCIVFARHIVKSHGLGEAARDPQPGLRRSRLRAAGGISITLRICNARAQSAQGRCSGIGRWPRHGGGPPGWGCPNVCRHHGIPDLFLLKSSYASPAPSISYSPVLCIQLPLASLATALVRHS